LEWRFSGHTESETDCESCHGPSLAHVADERNEAKPDHCPQGPAIAKQICLRCHETGCEETDEQQSCEKCHHVHALVDPSKPPQLKDDRLAELFARWQRFDKKIADGERLVERHQWKEAQQTFQAALELIPGDHRARLRLEMCSRRLRPELPGFAITGDEFHAATGLPREVAVEGLGTPMLLVPPGEFDMGSDDLPDSRPVHTVRVDAFYLGRYEVTQAEWKAVMGDNPSAHQGERYADAGRMPVERVSWNDCQEFLQRLNKRVPGGGFRLPTEAEWEYACRAGSGRLGEKKLAEHAWFVANSLLEPEPSGPFLQVDAYAPRPAGAQKPNAWGFSGMQGNVGEWCSSLSRPYLYRPDDGRESLTASGLRIVRGGSYADSLRSLHPAFRHTERPHRRLRFNGLRLARDVPSLK
jgi:formylglycine-generating enzyme required for sulfatase activity